MCSAYMQQIYRRTPMRKCAFWKVANQLYWNHTSAWVFSCTFSTYLQKSCFDEHLWGSTSLSFYSTCLPNFWIEICVKFGLFSNIFLTRSMLSSERAVLGLLESSLFLFRVAPCKRYYVTFCWTVFLQGGAWLNRYRNAAWTAR